MRSRRHTHAGPVRHADDWLITYADIITLLLCLFVVLVVLRGATPVVRLAGSAPDPAPAGLAFPPPPIVAAPPRDLRDLPQPLAGADAEADDQARNPRMAALGRPLPAEQEKAADVPQSADPAETLAAADTAEAMPDAAAAQSRDGTAYRRLAQAIGVAPGSGPGALDQAEGRLSAAPASRARAAATNASAATNPLRVMRPVPSAAWLATRVQAAPAETLPPTLPAARSDPPPGDRITIFQCSDTAFFASGSATLSAAGKGMLTGLLATLLAPRFAGYRITVEGHTDDAPISGLLFPSNWELSSARAAAVVRFLVEQGVPSQRLRAAGYADTSPLLPNRDAAGNPIPRNQAQNRRVVVELDKIDRAG